MCVQRPESVDAASVFEAAVLALSEFRRCGSANATFRPATRLTTCMRQPETQHTVSVGKLQAWLDGSGKSPNEQALTSRLRDLVWLNLF